MDKVLNAQVIDIESWERKDNFNFFRSFLNPFISITSEVECGATKNRAKERGESFFLHYLYAILRAANEVREMRFRIDNKERIICFDSIDVLCPIRMNESGKFYTIRIPWHSDFSDFYREARMRIDSVPPDGNPYEMDTTQEGDDRYNMIVVSATPNFYFSSITHAQAHCNGSDTPLINVGKAIHREGKLMMPIALSVHHGFMDGVHIEKFYNLIEHYLK